MVLFLIILLAVSIMGMFGLLWAKQYELSSGHLIFAGSRPKISRFSVRMVFLFGTALPAFVRYEGTRAYRAAAAWVHHATARGVLAVEHWLEKVLHTVREKTAPTRAPGEASAFLREVGEYKKKLTEGSEENRIDQE